MPYDAVLLNLDSIGSTNTRSRSDMGLGCFMVA
jgi:hypothetical protein